MRKIYTPLLVAALWMGIAQQNQALTIHTIGDSTMADYDESTTDKRGWGMMFPQFFTSGVTINNRAKSGASSKSFYRETAYWATVKPQIKAGDYVFIQFAHNDEKNNGLDGDDVILTDPTADYRGTTAQGTYKQFLRAYVNDTRALSATPVLVTPMCRKYFSGGTITRKGRHDLGENFGVGVDDHTYDYAYAMKELAVEMNVELIDLTALTKSMFEMYGDAACTAQLFCADDSTHPNAMGGTLVARLCANAMVSQHILADYVHMSTDLQVNPQSHDFGSAYVGQLLSKEFTVTGFDLTPTSGTLTLSVTDGFGIASTLTGSQSSSMTLGYTHGQIDFTRFYVTASLTQTGTLTGTLTLTNGTLTKTIPLTATAIELTGGTEVNLFWELSDNDNYQLTGPATPIAQTMSNMYVQRYAAPNTATVWPAESGFDATKKTQRDLLTGDVWPAGEIDEVSTRYMQFGIAANAGTELHLDALSLYVCGAGGNGMRCRIAYSTDNFANRTAIAEFPSMVSNNVYRVESHPVVKLAAGETLLLRVYPWYSSQATGKTICLANVTLHGMANTALATRHVAPSSAIQCVAKGHTVFVHGITAPCTVTVYDLSGQLVHAESFPSDSEIRLSAHLAQGVYVCKINTDLGPASCKFVID